MKMGHLIRSRSSHRMILSDGRRESCLCLGIWLTRVLARPVNPFDLVVQEEGEGVLAVGGDDKLIRVCLKGQRRREGG